MKRILFATVLAAGALAANTLLAHSSKEGTVPADGAVLDASPATIQMTFDSPMRLTLIELTDAAGSAFDVARSDDMAPVTQFEATPASLPPGTYTVAWRGLSGDGHPMQGSFSFEIAN